MRRTISIRRASGLLALALAFTMSVPADAGPSLSRKGERGETGAMGLTGPRGSDGANGAVGARGADGAEGVAGRDGRDGTDGADGVATVDVQSVATSAIVDVSPEGNPILTLNADVGRSLITVEAQANAENSASSLLVCELRADGATVADRAITLEGGAVESISASAVVDSARSLAFVCRKSSSVAVVQFPAERVRLSVLGA